MQGKFLNRFLLLALLAVCICGIWSGSGRLLTIEFSASQLRASQQLPLDCACRHNRL
jgi:hypothetical protein